MDAKEPQPAPKGPKPNPSPPKRDGLRPSPAPIPKAFPPPARRFQFWGWAALIEKDGEVKVIDRSDGIRFPVFGDEEKVQPIIDGAVKVGCAARAVKVRMTVEVFE